MNKAPIKHIFVGIVVQLAALAIFHTTRRWTEQFEVANLINMLSGLLLVVPGLIASLTIWSLFPALALGYGGAIGWFFSYFFQKKLKVFLFILLSTHLLTLLIVDILVARIPMPIFR